MSDNLIHYAAAPLAFDPTRQYEQRNPEFKPTGLWLTIDGEDGWKEWCESEQFGLDRLGHRTEFRVREGANILRLSTRAEIESLASQYPSGVIPGWVNWAEVVARYDGVLIVPYVWSARLSREATWYYAWDCASGCFWNLDALEFIPAEVAS